MKLQEHGHAEEDFGDSDFLAYRDIATNDFRKSEKESKIQIIKKMLELRHNMKYNQHLLSVYLKAKSLFDTMVDEQRAQITYLEEIYDHINGMIRDTHRKNTITAELLKDKKRIGLLLKKMRNSYDKLTNVYTVIDVTVQKMNELIASIEEADNNSEDEAVEAYDSDVEVDDIEHSELDSDVEADEDESDDTELEHEDSEYEVEADDTDVEEDKVDADDSEVDADDSEDEADDSEVDADDSEDEADDSEDEADEDDDAELEHEDREDDTALEVKHEEEEDDEEEVDADAPFIMVF